MADADLATAAAAAAAISPPSMYDILVSSLASRAHTHTKPSPQKRNRGTLAAPTGMSRSSEFKCSS